MNEMCGEQVMSWCCVEAHLLGWVQLVGEEVWVVVPPTPLVELDDDGKEHLDKSLQGDQLLSTAGQQTGALDHRGQGWKGLFPAIGGLQKGPDGWLCGVI